MKTFVLVLLLTGLTNLLLAQENIVAFNQFSSKENSSSKVILNSEYLNSVTHLDFAKKIQEIQNLVANYNIKKSDVYLTKVNSSYTVDFKDEDNRITAVYDKNGQIISCEENYKEIKLPYALASKLTKDYPNWGIKKVDCKIQYTKDDQLPIIVYQVVLNNDKKLKRISIQL
jgi:hypothetical protein